MRSIPRRKERQRATERMAALSTTTAARECIWTVIVNWRQSDATLTCLASLDRSNVDLDTVVVVDNEAHGDLERRVRAAYPDVVVLQQSANLGFAAAVNIGAQHALERGATAILLLNNDAELEPGALDGLASALASDPTVGVLTAKVYLSETPDRLWAAGGLYTGRRVIELGRSERDVGAYDDARFDFVYGCAMLVRADVLRDTGGFDERYFLYYEDIDLCLRAQESGWQVAMAPHAHVLHEGSRSTQGEPAIKVYHHARSRILFFSRHLRASRTAFALSEVAFMARRVGGHLMAGELSNALAYVRGTIDALRVARPLRPRPGPVTGSEHQTKS
jgi:GT2 family glycosyltransferase